jgi:hypothetical protein
MEGTEAPVVPAPLISKAAIPLAASLILMPRSAAPLHRKKAPT